MAIDQTANPPKEKKSTCPAESQGTKYDIKSRRNDAILNEAIHFSSRSFIEITENIAD